MIPLRRLSWLIAAVLVLTACAGSGGGLGVPDCGSDRGAAEAPVVKPDDVWTYRQINDYTKIDQGVFQLQVTDSSPAGIQTRLTLPGGSTVAETYDRMWGWKTVSNRGWDWLSPLAYGSPTVEFSPPFDSTPFPLRVGQTWSNNVVAVDPSTGGRTAIQISSSARCWEKITVPAGAFVALRIERRSYVQDIQWWKSQTTLRQVDWYLPEVNRVVMTWHDTHYDDYRQRPESMQIRGDRLRWELLEYKPGK
jgi:hypothetical protein